MPLARTKKDALDDLLPPPAERYELHYEGLSCVQDPFCTIRTWTVGEKTLIVATDECDTHQDCSVTNRIERIMFLAWVQAGRPKQCYFAEHYRREKGVREELDGVAFAAIDCEPLTEMCWSGGKAVGWQFIQPEWYPVKTRKKAIHGLAWKPLVTAETRKANLLSALGEAPVA